MIGEEKSKGVKMFAEREGENESESKGSGGFSKVRYVTLRYVTRSLWLEKEHYSSIASLLHSLDTYRSPCA
jgi:hypothetical protein